MDFYRLVDIGLDPFPYNGTTTTCEALWMGVPVITLLGSRHSGRVGASLLSQVGLKELIAKSKKEYLDISISLANNHERLNDMRNGLRLMLKDSSLMDRKSFTNALEQEYERSLKVRA